MPVSAGPAESQTCSRAIVVMAPDSHTPNTRPTQCPFSTTSYGVMNLILFSLHWKRDLLFSYESYSKRDFTKDLTK